MKKAVAYLRVSTDSQSTSSQRDKIQEYAVANGYEVEKWFEDSALSGTLDDRPQLLALKEWVPNNEGKSILMVGLDRLARDFAIFIDMSTLFNNYNVTPVYINCPSSGDAVMDTFLQNILASFASLEKELISQRFNRGKRFKLKNGIIAAGGPPLFGYKYRVDYYPSGKKDKYYEINEEEAETVRLMFRMLLSEKYKVQGIGRELTRLKIRTRSGTTRWAPSSTRSLLCNTTYMGDYRYGKTKMQGVGKNRHEVPRAIEEQMVIPVPPIITREEFARAQEILERLARGAGGRKRHNDTVLLSGLMICGNCNYRYSAGGRSTGKRLHSYYRCNSINRYNADGEHHSCGNATLKTAEADSAVWNALADILINPDKVKNTTDSKRRKEEIEGMYDDMISLVKRQEKIADEEKRIIDGYAKGLFGDSQVREYRQDLAEKNKEIGDKLHEINLQVSNALWEDGEIDFGKPKTRKQVDKYTFDKKRELIKTYITEVRVLPTEPTKLEIVFRLPIEPNKSVVTINGSPREVVPSYKNNGKVVTTNNSLQIQARSLPSPSREQGL